MTDSNQKPLVFKAIIFGAGGMGRRLFDILSKQKELQVVAFVDNDKSKHGLYYKDIPIYSPKQLEDLSFDYLYYGTQMGVNEIGNQIAELGVPLNKVKRDYIDTITNARKFFVDRYAEEVVEKKTPGAVAEAGVYRGEFAQYLNLLFPHKHLYLFDTFDGFDDRDFNYEKDKSLLSANHFKDTSVGFVLSRMKHRENCIICKGYFPDTLEGIEDSFIFVSLDLDLYRPTIKGLEYFYPRMVKGGCILIHDYFTPSYPNVKKAVDDFENDLKQHLHRLPIGDDISMAVIKV